MKVVKYLTLDGVEFNVRNPLDLVVQLRSSSFTASDDLEEFMKQTAKRCRLYSGTWIRTGNVEVFIEDLVTAKYLIPVK